MTTTNHPGNPSEFVVLAGNSRDGHAHGGHDHPAPPVANRRVQVKATDHPTTDRWIVLFTVRLAPTPMYRVGVVDGRNRPTQPPAEYPTLRRARNAANKLYQSMTEENER
jgi:hypothetical protein